MSRGGNLISKDKGTVAALSERIIHDTARLVSHDERSKA
jgi:hypothetical protein